LSSLFASSRALHVTNTIVVDSTLCVRSPGGRDRGAGASGSVRTSGGRHDAPTGGTGDGTDPGRNVGGHRHRHHRLLGLPGPGEGRSIGDQEQAPAKVKAGSVWTLEIRGAGCESDTFATTTRFPPAPAPGAETTARTKDEKLTMTWTAGAASGKVFKAKWKKSTGDYAGTYSGAGQSVSATLVPVATGGCAVVTTAPGSAAIGFGARTPTPHRDRPSRSHSDGGRPLLSLPRRHQPCTPTTPGVVDLGTIPCPARVARPRPRALRTPGGVGRLLLPRRLLR